MKRLIFIPFLLAALGAWAANPSFSSFNTDQFSVAGNKVAIKNAAQLTNLIVNSHFISATSTVVKITNSDYTIGPSNMTVISYGSGGYITLPSAASAAGVVVQLKCASEGFTLVGQATDTVDNYSMAGFIDVVSNQCLTLISDGGTAWSTLSTTATNATGGATVTVAPGTSILVATNTAGGITTYTASLNTNLNGISAQSLTLSNVSDGFLRVVGGVVTNGTPTNVTIAAGANVAVTTNGSANAVAYTIGTTNITVAAGANITVTTNGSANQVTYTIAGSAGGGGTNMQSLSLAWVTNSYVGFTNVVIDFRKGNNHFVPLTNDAEIVFSNSYGGMNVNILFVQDQQGVSNVAHTIFDIKGSATCGLITNIYCSFPVRMEAGDISYFTGVTFGTNLILNTEQTNSAVWYPHSIFVADSDTNCFPLGINIDLTNAAYAEGQQASFLFQATNAPDAPAAYFWYTNEVLAADNGSDLLLNGGTNLIYDPVSTWLTNVYCVASNSCSGATITSTPAVITVSCLLPGFAANPTNATVASNATASFFCTPTNYTSVHWLTNGVIYDGETASNLSFTCSIDLTNPGIACFASNSCGMATSAVVTLTVTNAGASSPNTTDLVLWFKADSLALAEDAAVDTWTNAALVGTNLWQGTAGNQPTYKSTNGPNGTACVRFGTDDALTNNYTIAAPPFTIWAVIKQPDNGERWLLSDTNNNIYAGKSFQNAKLIDVLNNTIEDGAPSEGTWWIVTYLVETTGNYSGILSNSVLTATDTNLTATPCIRNLILGNLKTINAGWNSDVAEVLIYTNALGTNATTWNYLSTKYNLP